MAEAPILTLEDVEKRFGGVRAVQKASFTVPRGAILGLIGPNGAGKTTLLNVVAGALPADGGRILLEGVPVRGGVPHRVARMGIVRTYQLAREWAGLTVLENLMVAPYPQRGENPLYALLARGRVRADEAALRAQAHQLLERFRLYDLRDERAGDLSGGQKKLLEIARALMTRPKLLLLDEPTAGVSPVLIGEIVEHVLAIRRQGITVVVVEHNLGVVDRVCDEVVVMASGTVLRRGRMEELRRDPEVIEAYLGGGVSDGVA